MPVRTDLQAMPLVIFHMEGDLNAAQLKSYLGEVEQLLSSGQKIGSISRTERLGKVDAQSMKLVADWFKQNASLASERWIGSAIVITSATVRFLLSSLMLLVRMPMPYKAFDSYDAAARWLAGRFRNENLPLPESLKPYV